MWTFVESFLCETPTPGLENLRLRLGLDSVVYLREILNSSNQRCTAAVYNHNSTRLSVGYTIYDYTCPESKSLSKGKLGSDSTTALRQRNSLTEKAREQACVLSNIPGLPIIVADALCL